MHVEVRQASDVMILDLKGKLTAGLGDQILRETIDELLAEAAEEVLLNLSEVRSSTAPAWASWWRGSRPPGASGRR